MNTAAHELLHIYKVYAAHVETASKPHSTSVRVGVGLSVSTSISVCVSCWSLCSLLILISSLNFHAGACYLSHKLHELRNFKRSPEARSPAATE